VTIVAIETAAELRDAVLAALPGADAVIMAAAVADYRPAQPADRKLKKREQGDEVTLVLQKSPDVLQAIVATRDARTIVVGFKAETGDPVAEASRMLREKRLDLVVANDVTAAGSLFGGDTNQVTFVSADGAEALPVLSKTEVARRLVAKIAERIAS
jgi:phosphopantothenoylcysteine decarboxylase/phosphopantothenate--cysteine ligase